MKVAVTYENGEVFQHFGHSEAFKLYEVEGGEVKSSEVVPTNGSGHGALAGFLRERGVEVLICGGIGAGAQNALAEAGIKLYGGVSGSADSAVQALIEGNLSYNPDVMCDHHGEDHHGDHENCGGHGEGHDSCGGHCGHFRISARALLWRAQQSEGIAKKRRARQGHSTAGQRTATQRHRSA